MNDRVAIFIDGSNLYHSLKNNFKRVDLNFAEFTKKLVGQRRLIRTYYYNVLQEPPGQKAEGSREQQDFLETLRKTQYLELRLGNTKLSQGVPVERGIDVMLATDMLYFAANNTYDIAILVSGDSDFGYTVQVVKNMGRHIEVAYFENAASRDLLNSADYLHELDSKFFTGLWMSGPKAFPSRRKKGRNRGHSPTPVLNSVTHQEESAPAPEPVPNQSMLLSPGE